MDTQLSGQRPRIRVPYLLSAVHRIVQATSDELLSTRLGLNMDQPALQCSDHCLRAIRHVEAHQNDADVTLDRGLSDAQVGSNLLVTPALDNQVENFAFSRTQIGVWQA